MIEGMDLSPPWAIAKARSCFDVGAQLPTRDGRVIGNAVVFDSVIRKGYFLLIIVTDAGTALDLTPKEVRELFHDPIWIMKVMDHPGVKHSGIWKY